MEMERGEKAIDEVPTIEAGTRVLQEVDVLIIYLDGMFGNHHVLAAVSLKPLSRFRGPLLSCQ